MAASILAYDFGTVATPIVVALIGASTVLYQVRTQRSNSRDHGHVVSKLDEVRSSVDGVKQVVVEHLAHHAHEERKQDAA